MEIQHVNVKLLLTPRKDFDFAPLIPIFNSWIQNQAPEDLLLDIADYRHVPAGPGVIVIGHQGNYSVDNTGERLGVRYNRKAALEGTNQDRLKQAAQAALVACRRLEEEPLLNKTLRFGGNELDIVINDRLLAPNVDATRQALHPELKTFSRKLFSGAECALAYSSEPRSLFSVTVRAPRPFSVADLLVNLSA